MTRCRVTLTFPTQRRLWAESAGFCSNPTCAEYVFDDQLDIDFGELAHIIPASAGGPRAVPLDDVSAAARADASNVLLLCPTCHRKVDKAPDAFPADVLRFWKKGRRDAVDAAVGTPRFTERHEARDFVEPLFDQNREIHRRYGPVGDPYTSGNPALWQRLARSMIVPNNRRLLNTMTANRALLRPHERAMVTQFALHVTQFEDRHVFLDFTSGTEQFPERIGTVFRDEEDGTHA